MPSPEPAVEIQIFDIIEVKDDLLEEDIPVETIMEAMDIESDHVSGNVPADERIGPCGLPQLFFC
jgi:hypothetical protein